MADEQKKYTRRMKHQDDPEPVDESQRPWYSRAWSHVTTPIAEQLPPQVMQGLEQVGGEIPMNLKTILEAISKSGMNPAAMANSPEGRRVMASMLESITPLHVASGVAGVAGGVPGVIANSLLAGEGVHQAYNAPPMSWEQAGGALNALLGGLGVAGNIKPALTSLSQASAASKAARAAKVAAKGPKVPTIEEMAQAIKEEKIRQTFEDLQKAKAAGVAPQTPYAKAVENQLAKDKIAKDIANGNLQAGPTKVAETTSADLGEGTKQTSRTNYKPPKKQPGVKNGKVNPQAGGGAPPPASAPPSAGAKVSPLEEQLFNKYRAQGMGMSEASLKAKADALRMGGGPAPVAPETVPPTPPSASPAEQGGINLPKPTPQQQQGLRNKIGKIPYSETVEPGVAPGKELVPVGPRVANEPTPTVLPDTDRILKTPIENLSNDELKALTHLSPEMGGSGEKATQAYLELQRRGDVAGNIPHSNTPEFHNLNTGEVTDYDLNKGTSTTRTPPPAQPPVAIPPESVLSKFVTPEGTPPPTPGEPPIGDVGEGVPVANKGRIFKSPQGAAGLAYRQAKEAGDTPQEGVDLLKLLAQRKGAAEPFATPTYEGNDAILNQSSPETKSWIEKIMGQGGGPDVGSEKGAIDPALLRFMGRSALGAAGGATLDQEDRTRGALLGAAAAGVGYPLIRAGYNAIPPEFRESVQGAVNPTLDALNKVRVAGLLSPYSVGKKFLGDAGNLAIAAVKNPDKIGDIAHAVTFGAPEVLQAFKEGAMATPTEARTGLENVITHGANPFSWSGRTIGGITDAFKNVYDQAGFSPAEAAKYTFSGDPSSKLAQHLLAGVRGSKLAQFITPFARMGLNRVEGAIDYSPLGYLKWAKPGSSAAEASEALKNANIGTGIMAAGYGLTPEDFAREHPMATSVIAAGGGLAGIPLAVAMGLKSSAEDPSKQAGKSAVRDIPGVHEAEGLTEGWKAVLRNQLAGFTNAMRPVADFTDPDANPDISSRDLTTTESLINKMLSNVPFVRSELPQAEIPNTVPYSMRMRR